MGLALPSPASCSWQARCVTGASMSPRSCFWPHNLSIWLSPPKLTLAGSRFSNQAGRLSSSDERRRPADQGASGRVSQRTQLALVVPTKRIELRYNLSGITMRSIPSRAGRALTAISPLVEGVPTTSRSL